MGQIRPSEVVYSAHTFHDKHYCLLFYSQPDTNLYIACLAAFVLAILILVLGLIKEAPFFDSCTMRLPTGHFQKMYSGSQNSPGKGHHLLLSSEIRARDSAAFPFNFLTQKGLTKSFFEQQSIPPTLLRVVILSNHKYSQGYLGVANGVPTFSDSNQSEFPGISSHQRR